MGLGDGTLEKRIGIFGNKYCNSEDYHP